MSGWTIGDEVFAASARSLGPGRLRVTVGGDAIEVDARVDRTGRDGPHEVVITLPDGRVVRAAISRDGELRWVSTGGRTLLARLAVGRARGGADHHGGLEAPMPGRIVRVAVKAGDAVTKGQTLVTLEAMKMEHALKAPRDGVVREVGCREGELVQAGTALVVLDGGGE